MRGTIIPIPENAPCIGEVYRHYKGDLYQVFELAEHSNDDEWMVVYKPLYENPDAHLFTRPVRQWREQVEWPLQSGLMVTRFTKVEDSNAS